jgi:pyruvate kinase
MDVARLNFSHGNHEQKRRIIRLIRRAEKKAGRPIAILQDLQGPKLRVGEFRGGNPVELKTGSTVTITTTPCFGSEERFFVDYASLAKDVGKDDPILLSDGSITLQVSKADATAGEVYCSVLHGGILYPRKGVNLPGIKLSISSMTEKDKTDLAFGIEQGVDWVALSFVREAKDILSLRRRINRIRSRLETPGTSVPPKIIAKIEKPEAVDAIREIMDAADGIMVARGDLGVEMKQVLVPVVQKEIINMANATGKPVITATQMLESMVHAPVPTRAEVSDVANAIFDGSDAIMLSAESAVGKYPLESVAYLDRIARETEASPLFEPRRLSARNEVSDAIAASACELAGSIAASCIVVFTHTGTTAIQVARFRPKTPIVALCGNSDICRQLMVYWNIKPLKAPVCRSINRLLRVAGESVVKLGCGKPGDEYVLVAGSSVKPGRTDWVKACTIRKQSRKEKK